MLNFEWVKVILNVCFWVGILVFFVLGWVFWVLSCVFWGALGGGWIVGFWAYLECVKS